MASIKLNISNADYDRIETAFVQQFIADPNVIANMTSQQRKSFVDAKVAEYIRGVCANYERVMTLQAVPLPVPPDVVPE